MSIVKDQQSRDPTPAANLSAAEKLLTQTHLPGNCGKVLYDLAWKANLHPQLYGYAKTLAVLQSILQAVTRELWDLTGSKDSDKALALAINNMLGTLKAAIDHLTSEEDHRKRVFGMVGRRIPPPGARLH
jgi:hypothetical protein